MLKKRLIFTLLFDGGSFVLSRNFRPQKVGDLNWLLENYNFSKVAFYIDELIILNITRNGESLDEFSSALEQIAKNCFVPLSAGGGIRSIQDAKKLLRFGADKIVLNSLIFDDSKKVIELSREFGRQCLIASLDFRRGADGSFQVYTEHANRLVVYSFNEVFDLINRLGVGEVYLNSIDRDGTGQGYDLAVLNSLPNKSALPIILAGGVGNSSHLMEGISDPRVAGVATANLFNFVGNGLEKARKSILDQHVDLASWPDLSAIDLLERNND
jgi:cyclase